jgi:HEAT repeat protein
VTWLEADVGAEERYRAVEGLRDDDGPALVQALRDDSWRVRRLAVDRLAKLTANEAIVGQLISLLGERGATGARNAAASVLAQFGAPALPSVIALLAHADPDQRKFAADILAELKRTEATTALVKALADDDGNVRAAAAEALGRIGGTEARVALDQLLTSPDPMLRVCALEGLAELEAPPPLPLLFPLLVDPWTRMSAFRVLGLVDHPTADLLIGRALASGASRDAGLVALGARGRLLSAEGDAEIQAVLESARDHLPWLTNALESEVTERRLGAIIAAHALAEPALATAVARAVQPGPTAELALTVLVRFGVRGARLLLGSTAALADLPGLARAVVGEALVRLSEPSLVPSLVNLLRAGDAELAELATRSLGRTRARAAIEPLLACFDDDALAAHAWRALVTLSESWPAEVREALSSRVAPGVPLRPHVVRAWAEVVADEALPVLQRALHEESNALRAAAADSAFLVPAQALTLLRSAMLDEAPVVRRAAMRALAQLPSGDAKDLLPRALADADATVLALAARAAGELVCADVSPRLLELCRHLDPGVVIAALGSLSVLGALPDDVVLGALTHRDPEVLKQLFSLGADRPALVARAGSFLTHPNWDVRVAAGRLLAVAGGEAERAMLRDATLRELDPVARESFERVVRELRRA